MKAKKDFKLLLIIVWIIFTVTLTIWLIMFNLSLLDQVQSISNDYHFEFARKQKMVLMEMSTLVIALFVGGGSLLYLFLKERKLRYQIHNFFSAFTHDLKTAITSIRLQVESLKDDIKEPSQLKLMERLWGDTLRLSIQLENSLFLSGNIQKQLIKENVSFKKIIETLKYDFSNVQIINDRDCVLFADQRAIESILKNIIQNAVVHGKATSIKFDVESVEQKVRLKITNNGTAFKGDVQNIAIPYYRHQSKSGSGLGLYIVKTLVEAMGGTLSIVTTPQFEIEIEISGVVK